MLFVVAEKFHADRRTDKRTDRRTADMTKLIVFRSFAEVPQKDYLKFGILWAEAAQISVFWNCVTIILG